MFIIGMMIEKIVIAPTSPHVRAVNAVKDWRSNAMTDFSIVHGKYWREVGSFRKKWYNGRGVSVEKLREVPEHVTTGTLDKIKPVFEDIQTVRHLALERWIDANKDLDTADAETDMKVLLHLHRGSLGYVDQHDINQDSDVLIGLFNADPDVMARVHASKMIRSDNNQKIWLLPTDVKEVVTKHLVDTYNRKTLTSLLSIYDIIDNALHEETEVYPFLAIEDVSVVTRAARKINGMHGKRPGLSIVKMFWEGKNPVLKYAFARAVLSDDTINYMDCTVLKYLHENKGDLTSKVERSIFNKEINTRYKKKCS